MSRFIRYACRVINVKLRDHEKSMVVAVLQNNELKVGCPS